jgi:hypothetical protein
MSQKLQSALQIIARHLDDIERSVFKKGAGMKLTFIARDPKNPEADMLVSEDDLNEIAELLKRSAGRETVKGATE